MIAHVEIRHRTYHDSVRLMQASAAVQRVAGVESALVAMATDLNLALLADLGFEVSGTTPDDMVVAVRATDEAIVALALVALDEALVARAGDGDMAAPEPRTIGTAAARAGADLALISVPGANAFVEAAEALASGLHVMLFSDNVPVHEEVALKQQGIEAGLLVMGPDCGTAVVSGLGLGFANAVRPGPVSLVGASGTGIQQLCCLLDAAGVGVRHALGTGSRDLSSAVGGGATLQALAALDEDPATEVIVIVSKPPAPEVAEKVAAAAAGCATPTVMCLIGQSTLEDGAAAALQALRRDPIPPVVWPARAEEHRPGTLRGLFAGGTLRDEARMIVSESLGEGAAADMIDFGDDEYTRGRPHPMIDQRLRLEHLAETAADRSVGVALIDVVLGHGAHADPASEMAPVVAEATGSGLGVVISLCGTSGDPQGRDAQASALHEAGAALFLSNAAAARHAVALVGDHR
jgi:FdrA protein